MADVEDLYALESLPEVVRHQAYPPRTRQQATQVVEEIVRGQGELPRKHWELAVERVPGSFIGRVGAWVEGDQAALWYAFMPAEQGKGYATEAMRAFTESLPPVEKLTIECDPRNVPSWRLAERLGFTLVALRERALELKGEWVGSMVYERRNSGD